MHLGAFFDVIDVYVGAEAVQTVGYASSGAVGPSMCHLVTVKITLAPDMRGGGMGPA